MKTQKEMIEEVQQGNTAVIHEILEAYKNLIRKEVHKHTYLFQDDKKETEAVVVHAVIEGIYSYDVTKERTVQHHLTICINNRMQQEKRAQKRRQERHEEPQQAQLEQGERMDQLVDKRIRTPEEQYLSREKARQVQDVLHVLSQLERDVLYLRGTYRYTYEEIGQRLGISRKRAGYIYKQAVLTVTPQLARLGQNPGKKRRFS